MSRARPSAAPPPAEQRGPGRPSKLTPEAAWRALAAVSVGALHKDIAEFAGVHRDTLRAWLDLGASAPDRRAFGPSTGPVHQETQKPLWHYPEGMTYGQFLGAFTERAAGRKIGVLRHWEKHIADSPRACEVAVRAMGYLPNVGVDVNPFAPAGSAGAAVRGQLVIRIVRPGEVEAPQTGDLDAARDDEVVE